MEEPQWRDMGEVLKANARHEFEQARYESDPEVVTRLLVVGRDSLNKTMEKVAAKSSEIQQQPNGTPGSPPNKWN